MDFLEAVYRSRSLEFWFRTIVADCRKYRSRFCPLVQVICRSSWIISVSLWIIENSFRLFLVVLSKIYLAYFSLCCYYRVTISKTIPLISRCAITVICVSELISKLSHYRI